MTELNLTEDVLGLVVRELKDDRKSLLACSVVARAWSAPSQKQLVARAHVNGIRVAERLRYTLREAPWLAPHIQQLHVHSDAVSGLIDIHNVLETPLPRLRRLHLTHNLQGGVFGGDIPLPHFQTIQHLQLGPWRFTDLWHMQRFFAQFRSLTSLCVGHGLFQITQSVMDMPAPNLNLSDLKIDDLRPVDAMRLCSWLGAGRPIIPPGITVLHMSWSLLFSVNISECASGLHELLLSDSSLCEYPTALSSLSTQLTHDCSNRQDASGAPSPNSLSILDSSFANKCIAGAKSLRGHPIRVLQERATAFPNSIQRSLSSTREQRPHQHTLERYLGIYDQGTYGRVASQIPLSYILVFQRGDGDARRGPCPG
jgi:hypothetical protein